jgi:transposase-like protein
MEKNRVYSREFMAEVVRRISNGESVSALAAELGISRKLLYEWKQRVSEGGEENLRVRGRPRKGERLGGGEMARNDAQRIAELERLVGRQQLAIDFFKQALLRIEELRQRRSGTGATASSKPSKE